MWKISKKSKLREIWKAKNEFFTSILPKRKNSLILTWYMDGTCHEE